MPRRKRKTGIEDAVIYKNETDKPVRILYFLIQDDGSLRPVIVSESKKRQFASAALLNNQRQELSEDLNNDATP